MGHRIKITVVSRRERLDSSPAALGGVHLEQQIGVAAAPGSLGTGSFWSEIYQPQTTYSVVVGTKLIFRYSTFHNVYLLPSKEAYDNCDFSGAQRLAGEDQGGGEGDLPNLYETVTQAAARRCTSRAERHDNFTAGRGRRSRSP